MRQYYEKGVGLEPLGKEVKGKAERCLEEIFGKRHTRKWTGMEHSYQTSPG